MKAKDHRKILGQLCEELTMATPRVFISYSHDSPEHKQWVLEFGSRLHYCGIEAVLDMWALQAGDDLPTFMADNLVSVDRVLMVCTDKYVQKANAGIGGVGYEKMIVTADLAQSINSNKVIPIIRQTGTRHVPTFLRTKLFIDFSQEEQFEFAFDELVRTLHNAPLYVKPEIGKRPDFSKPPSPSKTGDPMLALMKAVVAEFESSTGLHCEYSKVLKIAQREGMSRLYFDKVLADSVRLGLVIDTDSLYGIRFMQLTEKGKE